MSVMSDRSDRLRAAMKRAKLTQKEACERWGWNPNTLKSNMNGKIDYGYKKAQVYGGRLKVRAEWLYDGQGEMTEQPRNRRATMEIPVIAWVSAGQLADIGDLQEIEELDRLTVDGLPEGSYFATPVVGDSMDRVSPEGSTIIVRADKSRPIQGGYYVLSLNGETTYKRYYDDPVVRFEPHSTNPANRPIYPPRENWEVVGQVVRSFIDLDRG